MKNLKMNCRILVSTLLITGMMMCTDVVFGQCALCNSSQNIEIGLGSATGFLSNAFGNATSSGDYGFSIGSKVFASGKKSFVVGYKAEAYSGDTLNYIFGCGTEDDNLLNDVSNSIMFGTNSNLPTVLVSGASGFNTWGNVGIGNITDPESLLHVRDQVRVGLTGSAAGSLIFNNSAGDTISFNTPASMSDQNYTLPTALGVNGDVLTYTTGGQLTWTNGGTATDDWRLDGNNNATSSSKLGTLNAQPLMIYANGLERMRVTTNGNVGIGITSPSVLLHLQATAASGNGEPLARFTVSDNSSGLLQFENRTSTNDEFAPSILGISTLADSEGLHLTGRFDSGNDSGTTPAMTFDARIVGNTNITARPLFRWRRASGTLMQMDASGNLGIGTTSPQGKLDVNGTVFINANLLGTPTLTTNDHYVGIDIGTNQLIDLGASTIEFKDDVEDLEFDKEAFLNLRAVDFRWKPFHGGQMDVGLIAQEVAQTFPALATSSYKRTYLPNGDMERDSLGIPIVDSTQTEVRGVRYHKLPVYLLALAKDQQNELDELRHQIQELTNRLDGCCTDIEPMNRLNGEEGQTGSVREQVDEFILLRNDPNPFADYTDIRYDHEACMSCEVIVTDAAGRIVKRMKTSGARGVVRVYSSELGTGMFVYSLVKDGSIVRSETMVSSKQ